MIYFDLFFRCLKAILYYAKDLQFNNNSKIYVNSMCNFQIQQPFPSFLWFLPRIFVFTKMWEDWKFGLFIWIILSLRTCATISWGVIGERDFSMINEKYILIVCFGGIRSLWGQEKNYLRECEASAFLSDWLVLRSFKVLLGG